MKGTSAYNPRQVPDGQIISVRNIFDQRFWFCEDAGLFQKIRQRLNQRIRDTFPLRVPGNVHGSPMRTVNNAPSGPVLPGNDPHKRRLAKRAASIRVSSPILPIQFEISIMRHALNDLAHRLRAIRNVVTTTWRCGATIGWSAGLGRIPVLGLPGSELKDALPRQPRGQIRYQHAGDDHRACPGRHHNAELSNLHNACEFLNTTASIYHRSSGSGNLPRLRSGLQHLPTVIL